MIKVQVIQVRDHRSHARYLLQATILLFSFPLGGYAFFWPCECDHDSVQDVTHSSEVPTLLGTDGYYLDGVLNGCGGGLRQT